MDFVASIRLALKPECFAEIETLAKRLAQLDGEQVNTEHIERAIAGLASFQQAIRELGRQKQRRMVA